MKKYSGIGGQAVMEGVMMRNKNRYAVACRKPDGEIVVDVKETHSITEKLPFLGWPFLRGTVSLIESMVIGIKTLMYSADFIEDEHMYTIYTEPDDLTAVSEALTGLGYVLESAEKAKVPSTYVSLSSPEDVEKMEKLLDYLDEDDDVVNVYHNWDENA